MVRAPAGVTILLPGGTKTSRLLEVSVVCTACTQRDEVPASFTLFKVVGRASSDALPELGSSHIAPRKVVGRGVRGFFILKLINALIFIRPTNGLTTTTARARIRHHYPPTGRTRGS